MCQPAINDRAAWCRIFRPGAGAWVVLSLLLFVGCAINDRRAARETAARAVPTDLMPVRFEERENTTSFVSDDRAIEVVFLDAGEDAGFILRAAGNVLVHADVDRDGRKTPMIDRSFGLNLDNHRACSWYIDSQSADCGEAATAARAAAVRKGQEWEISMRIPKRELGTSRTDALVVFEVFPVSGNESPAYFPRGEHFQRVFRLVYASPGKATDVLDKWPAAAPVTVGEPPASPVTFVAYPKSFYQGQSVCLHWDMPGKGRVSLEPGLGEFDSKGTHCFSPDKSMTITLRAGEGEGALEIKETVQLRDVEIAKFRCSRSTVRFGESFFLEWHVDGATGVSLERTGWTDMAKSGSTFGSSIASTSTKVTVNVTRKEFGAPGHFTYNLKAEGPGGPKYKTVEIEVAP